MYSFLLTPIFHDAISGKRLTVCVSLHINDVGLEKFPAFKVLLPFEFNIGYTNDKQIFSPEGKKKFMVDSIERLILDYLDDVELPRNIKIGSLFDQEGEDWVIYKTGSSIVNNHEVTIVNTDYDYHSIKIPLINTNITRFNHLPKPSSLFESLVRMNLEEKNTDQEPSSILVLSMKKNIHPDIFNLISDRSLTRVSLELKELDEDRFMEMHRERKFVKDKTGADLNPYKFISNFIEDRSKRTPVFTSSLLFDIEQPRNNN